MQQVNPQDQQTYHRGGNQTDSSITQVMQEEEEEEDKVIPRLPTWNNIGSNISRIFNRRHLPND
jgi:hypothetical protein